MLKPMSNLPHKEFAKIRARQNVGTMRLIVQDNKLYYDTDDLKNYKPQRRGRPINIKENK